MVKTELTDEVLGNAARLVRESMLSSLREGEMPAHEFSEDFRESLLEEVRRNEQERARKRLVLRRCIAALQWAKKTTWGRTVFSFFGDAEKALPEFEVTWLPEGVELVQETSTSETRTKVYYNTNDTSNGFVLECGIMDPDSEFFVIHDDADYEISPVQVNTSYGTFYISQSKNASHGLVWFHEKAGVYFSIISYLDPAVILHIAESVKLVNSTK